MMFILALLALAQTMPYSPVPAAEATPQATCRLCDPDRLRPFMRKLATARQADRPVRILQIGDSHTAGDQITGSWRTILQARYGGGGRGVLPPGRPYEGYLTRGITVAQGPGWSVSGIFGPAWHDGAGPLRGLTGYSLSTTQDGAFLSLVADPTEYFDRFTVCALTGPGAGTVRLTAATATASLVLDAPTVGSACQSLDTGNRTGVASLTASGGPVTLTSWATEASTGGGVILSNLGTVGAQLVHWTARTDDRLVAAELARYQPDLVVIAFGTNEAFMPRFSAAGYTANLKAGIGRVQRLLPGVPVLVIGAGDSGTKLPALQSGEGGMAPSCNDGSPWSPTAALPVVQATQRRVAHELGTAYWDWSQAMGGRCTANRWSAFTPPLMRGDHVHFTSAGGAEVARLLQADLDLASERILAGER
jgi:lysophospholipase L1-like esterase